MLEFLKRICLLAGRGRQNGESARSDPIAILKRSYRLLSALATQLDEHAEKAPYPQAAARLRRIAAEKRAGADRLRERLARLGASIDEVAGEGTSARNHWERVVLDLQEHKELETGLFDQAALLADGSPELAELLREIAALQTPHTEALLDLVARADPQADQT